MDVPFHIIYVVIDKREIHSDFGLTWEESFFKLSHRRLYRALSRRFDSLNIIADNLGSTGFPESFRRYVEERHNTLFHTYSFKFDTTQSNTILQLASFIAETLYFGFEDKKSEHYDVLLESLEMKVLFSEVFPGEYEDYLRYYDFDDVKFDREIAELSIYLAAQYIKEHELSEEMWEIKRVFILNRLLFYARFSPKDYLNTGKLMNMVKKYLGYKSSEQEFRAEVIGRLRDNGVLIASSDKGYKIPLTLNEAYGHCDRMIQMILPMLGRLQKFRKGILTATENELDIFNQPDYKNIKVYFDVIGR